MKVSIITVCFNSQDTIKETIESVISQTYKNIEYIVIDGKSDDGTSSVINQFNTSISKFVSEKDNGIYDALNKGIRMSTGDVVGFLHADDVFDNKTVIEKVVKSFDVNIDILYGDINYVNRNNLNKIVRKWKSSTYSKNKFKWGWMPPHTSFFLKRTSYLKYGLYNLNLGTSADYELMLRMFEVHQLSSVYLPSNITKMRMGGVSNSSFINRLKANKNDKKSWIINSLKPYWFTFLLKPLLKIKQFI